MAERDLLQERERVVRLHMEAENVHDFDTVIGTFSHPRYKLSERTRGHWVRSKRRVGSFGRA